MRMIRKLGITQRYIVPVFAASILLSPSVLFANSPSQDADIMLVLDLSGSMQAEDLQPNRLEAAKDVCRHFVDGLASDRVGLTVFAGKSFTQCPLTIDYEIIKNFTEQQEMNGN